jgi:ribosomal-protein-alanine N-acetyltransferase
MAPAMVFEPMVPADLPAVMEIERLAFDAPWTPGLFLHELKIPFSRLMLARAAGGRKDVAGYVCWWLVGDEVHILNLAVHPDWRRRGTGRALVGLVLDEASLHDAASVSLEVRRENSAAQALYRSLAFVDCGVRRNYYGRGQDAIVMFRHLSRRAATAADPRGL